MAQSSSTTSTSTSVPDPQSLQKEFEAALHFITTFKPDPDSEEAKFSPSNDLKLLFYGYYKQSIEGNITGKRPGFWDPINQAKYDAWEKNKNLTKQEAQAKYIQILDDKYPPWRKYEGLDKPLSSSTVFNLGSTTTTTTTILPTTVTSTIPKEDTPNPPLSSPLISTTAILPSPLPSSSLSSTTNDDLLSPTLSTPLFNSPLPSNKNTHIYADFTSQPIHTTITNTQTMQDNNNHHLLTNEMYSPLGLLSPNSAYHNTINTNTQFSPSVLLQTGRRLTIDDAASILERRLSHSQLSRLCAELQATVAGQNERIVQASEQLNSFILLQQYNNQTQAPLSSTSSSSTSQTAANDHISIFYQSWKLLRYTVQLVSRYHTRITKSYSSLTIYSIYSIISILFYYWYKKIRNRAPYRLK